jgi:hypothetical protein
VAFVVVGDYSSPMIRFAFTVVVLCGFIAPPSGALTLQPDAALDAATARVVDVVVVSQRAAWVGRRIVTFVHVKTAIGENITVAIPGGVVDDIGQHVPGAPVLVAGQSYRLRLSSLTGPADPNDSQHRKTCGIVGFSRGVTAIAQDGSLL